MIDWLTLSIDIIHLSERDRQIIQGHASRLQKISPDGDILWETGSFESLRSDFQGLAYSYGTRLTIAGSPASVTRPNNVFGSSDIIGCCFDMLSFFDSHMSTKLLKTISDLSKWKCSRIDFTLNYDLGGQASVSQALHYLRHSVTRGNNIDRKHETVYWNKTSTMRSGKAYNKYLHALHMTNKRKSVYTKDELMLTRNLLRLELKLGRHWIRKQNKQWHELTADDLRQEHTNFFSEISSDIEVPTMDTLLDKLIAVCPTVPQAMKAHSYYLMVREHGSEFAKSITPKSSYYRYRKQLKQAGLTNADLTSGEIIHLRPKIITMTPVSDWSEISSVA